MVVGQHRQLSKICLCNCLLSQTMLHVNRSLRISDASHSLFPYFLCRRAESIALQASEFHSLQPNAYQRLAAWPAECF